MSTFTSLVIYLLLWFINAGLDIIEIRRIKNLFFLTSKLTVDNWKSASTAKSLQSIIQEEKTETTDNVIIISRWISGPKTENSLPNDFSREIIPTIYLHLTLTNEQRILS